MNGSLHRIFQFHCLICHFVHVGPAIRVFIFHGVQGSLAKFLTHAFLAPLVCPPFFFTKMEEKEIAPLRGLGCMSQYKDSQLLADSTLWKQGICPWELPLTLNSEYGKTKMEWSRVVSHGELCLRRATGLSGQTPGIPQQSGTLWLLLDLEGHFHLASFSHLVPQGTSCLLCQSAEHVREWLFCPAGRFSTKFLYNSFHQTQKSGLVTVKILWVWTLRLLPLYYEEEPYPSLRPLQWLLTSDASSRLKWENLSANWELKWGLWVMPTHWVSPSLSFHPSDFLTGFSVS